MREIKFRAKAVDEQYGLVEFNLSEIGNWDSSCDVFYANEIPCLINSIQEFTGLKDKNGKEIYEGDVVKAHALQGMLHDEAIILEIEWTEDRNTTGWNIGYKDDIEIIGNVHENPELLNHG